MFCATGEDEFRFYPYKDRRTGRVYFHNPITNEVVWQVPVNARVSTKNCSVAFDTEIPVQESKLSPPLETVLAESIPRVRSTPMMPRASFSVAPAASNGQPKKKWRKSMSAKLSDMSDLAGLDAPMDNRSDSSPVYMPDSIQADQNPIDWSEFARDHLRRPHKLFGRSSSASADEICLADDNSSSIPVLKKVDDRKVKNAKALFTYILSYGKRDKAQPISSYLNMLKDSPELIDEAFIQLIRQTRNNPSIDAMHRMWDLLFVISTLFSPSPFIQGVVRHVLAKSAFGQNKAVAQIAQVTYLRFDARCRSCSSMRAIPPGLTEIPAQLEDCPYVIGMSLFELMWRQRKSHPRLPIPLLMHKFCEYLIEKGALESEGTFQQAPPWASLEKLASILDSGRDIFAESDLAGMAGLFKKWLLELPVSLIPPEAYPSLVAQRKSMKFIQVIEAIPRVHRDSLAYLVGFLKVFAAANEKTKVDPETVARLFGSNCMRVVLDRPEEIRESSELAREVMQKLIDSWDVQRLYPLDPELLS
jgi:hypothetical protein